MGMETAKAVIKEAPEMQLVGAVDPRKAGLDLGDLIGVKCDFKISDELSSVLSSTSADVLVDFTNPQAVLHNARTALEYGVAPVIGTTGLDSVAIDELEKLAKGQVKVS